jgi:hypothetical protein
MNKLVVLEAGVSRRGLAESIGVDKDDVGFQYYSSYQYSFAYVYVRTHWNIANYSRRSFGWRE